MTAGELRHRVTVQARAEVSDGHDGFTESWSAVRTRIAAKVMPLDGRDLERAQQIDPRASHTVALRFWTDYRVDLAGGRARLIFHDGDVGDRTLEIVAPPREFEPRESLLVTCREDA